MRPAISYNRFSSLVQGEGDSEQRQTKGFGKFCQAHELIENTSYGQFFDKGRSGFHGKHRQGDFGKLLDLIANGKIEKGTVLVIEDMDRFSREAPLKVASTLQEVLNSGIDLGVIFENKIYTAADLTEIGALLTLVVKMAIAHEKSKTLSARLKSVWASKRTSGKRMTENCPWWMIATEDGFRFNEHKTTAERIVDMGMNGYGYGTITKTLNSEKVPCPTKTGHWSDSLISDTLHNVALIGQFQARGRDTKRSPIGEPIGGYFPALISEKDYWHLQTAIKGRTKQRGRRGKCVTNLFTGLFRSADDGAEMHLKMGSTGRHYLVSKLAARGLGGKYRTTQYRMVEDVLLTFLYEINPAELITKQVDTTDTSADELAELDGKIGSLKAKLKARGSVALADVLFDLEDQRKALSDRIKAKKGHNEDAALEIKPIVDQLASATGAELENLRSRLRALIAQVVETIHVRTVAKRTTLELVFRNKAAIVKGTGYAVRVFTIDRKGKSGHELVSVEELWGRPHHPASSAPKTVTPKNKVIG